MATDPPDEDNLRAQALFENPSQNRKAVKILSLLEYAMLSKCPGTLDYLSNQFRELCYTHPDEEPDEWQVNFAALQRMILAELQDALITKIRQIEDNRCQVTVQTMAEIEPILARYSNLNIQHEIRIELIKP